MPVLRSLYLRNLSATVNKTRIFEAGVAGVHSRAVQREMLAQPIFEKLAPATEIVSIPERSRC